MTFSHQTVAINAVCMYCQHRNKSGLRWRLTTELFRMLYPSTAAFSNILGFSYTWTFTHTNYTYTHENITVKIDYNTSKQYWFIGP